MEILKNSQNNTCARVSFLINKRLLHRCFPVNFAKFLRTPFLQNTSGGCFCTRLLGRKRKCWVREVLRNRSVNDAYYVIFQECSMIESIFFSEYANGTGKIQTFSKSSQRKRKVYSAPLKLILSRFSREIKTKKDMILKNVK